MTPWLVAQGVRRAPRRVVLGAIGTAFPVAILAATLLFVDAAVRSMTPQALGNVQVEMRALATSLNVDMTAVSKQLATVPGVQLVQPFGATDVVVGTTGTPGLVTARLFAIDPSYLDQHPWVDVVDGGLSGGALLDLSLRASPGFASATNISITLPGDSPPLKLALPVDGTVDLRQARTWFSIPYGEVQGDLALVPRAVIIDFATFEHSVLPVLRSWADAGGISPVLNPGLTDLPPADLEAHITIDHSTYPFDPGRAASWSAKLRRSLERQGAGSVIVADNAAETLSSAAADATNAKILFLLLGIPGVLVAAGLGLAASSALAEAHRREEALLRLRGATSRQVARVAAANAALAGLAGSVLGLLVAVAVVSADLGQPAWRGVSPARLASSALVAVGAGALTTVIRLVSLRRASRRSDVVPERRLLERGYNPLWKRARLDLVAIAVGVAILAINTSAGGLRQSPIEGPALALSFYVLLAPIALWLGVTLLVIRSLLALLGRWARPDRSRPLPSWRGASLRWLGRRPARTAVAVVLGALAVAFGTQAVAFVATYRAAMQADAQAAIGSDLRLTPGSDPLITLPTTLSGVFATSPVRLVPARAGSDRKTILAIDLATYRQAATVGSRMLSGQGLEALATDPSGILVASEIANDFSVAPGDTMPVTIFPDDFENSQSLDLHVLGVFRSFPPTAPTTEMVMSTAGLPPRDLLAPADFYLARVDQGRSPTLVADELRRGALADTFTVGTVANPDQRSLAALNLGGLSRIESFGAGLVAAVGVAVLGVFLVLERRREFAILSAIGATNAHVLTGPAQEGIIAVIASVIIGVPVGLGLASLTVRVLGLFFTLPPPLLTIPTGTLIGLAVFVAVTSAIALAAALTAVTRVSAASVLRDP